jgi:vancomycin resistance protein VanJ
MEVQQDTKLPSRVALPMAAAKTGDLAAPRRRDARSIWIRIVSAGFIAAVWLYLALLLAVWLMIYYGSDRWWLATVVLFGPRWVCGLPLAALVPAAAVARRRLLWPLAACAIVVVWPIMGCCLPWARLVGSSDSSIRVLTCNLKGHCRDNAALNKLIADSDPDIVALQGCSDVRIAWPAGWHVYQERELLVASRYPIGEVRDFPRANVYCCVVSLPQREIAFCSLHFPSPRWGLSESLDRRTLLSPRGSPRIEEESEDRRRQSKIALEMASEIHKPLILAGDFNTPADSTIYRDTWGRFSNAFSRSGFGFGHTELPSTFGWPFGVRIDHILGDPHWRPCRCWVGPDVGSDHLPLIADLAWIPGGGN